jgi:hypothetical protein
MQRLGGNVGLWRRSDEGDSYNLGSVALVYGDAAMRGTATSWGALRVGARRAVERVQNTGEGCIAA